MNLQYRQPSSPRLLTMRTRVGLFFLLGKIMNNNNVGPILKPPTTFKEQVQILSERGLIIEDEDFAINILSSINYYRFTAYLLPFKNCATNRYKSDTSFNHIYRIYEFDRKLKSLIMSAIEPIEILVRTKLAYFHAHKYGAEGYISSDNCDNPRWHDKFIKEFQETIQKQNKALFVRHHIEKYGNRLPIWVATETFSFGMLSKFYSNMKPEDRKHIAKYFFNTGPEHLRSWLVCLAGLRNLCAHYMRLYFHRFVNFPKLPRGPYQLRSEKVFDIIYIMKFLYLDHNKWVNGFVYPLESLIESYSEDIDLKYIGFPENWVSLLKARDL